MAFTLTHDDHNAASACLVFLEAATHALGFLVAGANVAAKVCAINLDMTFQHVARLNFTCPCFARFVGQNESCFVLTINVA